MEHITWGGILFIVVFALIIAAIFIVPKLIRGEISFSRRYRGKADSKAGKAGPPNSLNIYPDHIAFEFVEKPAGMTWKDLNDDKEYYVHHCTEGKKVEWQLPDDDEKKRYYDPGEFANVVTMVCTKRYLIWKLNKFQKIAFAVMGVIVGAELITLIVVLG